MGSMPTEFWWFVVIGTGIVVGFLVAFVGSLVLSNRVLKEEKDFTYSIMKTTTALMLVLDENGIIRRFNKAFEELSGFKAKELEGRKLRNTKLCESNPQLEKLLKKPSVSDGTVETIFFKKTGNRRILDWTYNFFEGISEKKSWSIWTGSDITDLVKTQHSLEEMNKTLETTVEKRTEELRSLIEQSPFAILIFNPNGDFVRSNKVFEKVIAEKNLCEKLNAYNYLKTPFLFDEEFIYDSKNIFFYGGNFISNKLNVENDLRIFNFDPKIKWVVLRFYGVQDNQRNVFRVACLIEDVTEQKMVEEAYLQLKEQKIKSAAILSTLEQERQRISQELHDGVQQILTSAKIKLDTFEMTSGISNKFVKDSSDLLMKTSVEIRRIINDLHPQEIDKYGLFPAIESLAGQIKSTKNIEVNFENTFVGSVNKIYHLPIYRIIQEAIGNIIKHSECTKCMLAISGTEKYINIELKDNGKGFKSNGTVPDGSGHGLINMRKRAEFIGGKFIVESEIDKGTKILLTIPLEKYGET